MIRFDAHMTRRSVLVEPLKSKKIQLTALFQIEHTPLRFSMHRQPAFHFVTVLPQVLTSTHYCYLFNYVVIPKNWSSGEDFFYRMKRFFLSAASRKFKITLHHLYYRFSNHRHVGETFRKIVHHS